MKRKIVILLIAPIIFICAKSISNKPTDGSYTGSSCASYCNEPYIGIVTIEVKSQKIVNVDFQIKDTLNNEIFGSDYEKHYPNNAEYRQQCRKDWQGVLNYPKQFIEKQDLSKVDGISGATWSFNLFKASVTKALAQNQHK